MCYDITCTLYTSQYNNKIKRTVTCKYYLAGKKQISIDENRIGLKLL